MVDVAIVVQALDKRFGEGRARMRMFMQVSFEVGFNEMLFIVGPPGSGKTTLLSVISSILRPDSDRAMVDGIDIWSLSADTLADFRLGRAGFVFQGYHLFPRFAAVENAAIPLIPRYVAWDAALDQTVHYLDVVGLRNRAQLPSVKLNGDKQQRVAIAYAIATQPDTLILGGPIASLDGDIGRSVTQLVKTKILNVYRCIVIMTRDTRILDLASRILDMKDGKLGRIEHGAMR